MPRRQTDKVLQRKDQILELLKKHGELTTSAIMRLTGMSHSQIFYVLKMLEKEGYIREVRRGKVAYWRFNVEQESGLKEQ
ncbi:MAG: winged helix-turn-helix transcriptional regulator [Thermoproteus sp.]|jgi:DeoR/GlpR family transcriptional regulator of sugar metabolism|uniref:FaeA/PapI family transcriptional regulator n=1 Tax=Thermoproteus sp. CP80 TaxID=1650659 RepID=UPI0007468785|nr:FaeA/PapI family transcriptional regulator [Thermoproteus sp. CP80]KUO85117.1 MAG: DNA-binding protein [Thermoproteus sp. CIS_19]MDT7868739.1 winged helix-turn-helix transcriptional regulator [Thermoproteus sp.]MDT7881048.1 winged helix-turn-helix transcriptional regulator [Thermoproteus sp.]PLC62269.1 DNA-binding protein [Thermoproteus sp. CP80]